MTTADGEQNRRQGARAERLAERHLKSLGYRPLGRNLVIGGSEIDLLMQDRRNHQLVVIEVKSSRIGEHHARAALGAVKRRRIARAVRDQRLGLTLRQIRVEAIWSISVGFDRHQAPEVSSRKPGSTAPISPQGELHEFDLHLADVVVHPAPTKRVQVVRFLGVIGERFKLISNHELDLGIEDRP